MLICVQTFATGQEGKLRETEGGGRDENEEEDARKTEVCESGQDMFLYMCTIVVAHMYH